MGHPQGGMKNKSYRQYKIYGNLNIIKKNPNLSIFTDEEVTSIVKNFPV